MVTLVVSDGLTSATNTTTIHAAPPAITISQPGIGALTLTLPAWATGYALYSTTNLAPPILWSPATDTTLSTNGPAIIATLPATSNTTFFRLSPQIQ